MNIVHFLSPPVDLSPLYQKPIPLECVTWERGGLLNQSKQFWDAALTNQQQMVIDPGETSVYYQLDNEDDILSLPGANTAQSLFIYAAFILGVEWDPVTLFLPGHIMWSNDELMGSLIRHLQKDDFSHSHRFDYPDSLGILGRMAALQNGRRYGRRP